MGLGFGGSTPKPAGMERRAAATSSLRDSGSRFGAKALKKISPVRRPQRKGSTPAGLGNWGVPASLGKKKKNQNPDYFWEPGTSSCLILSFNFIFFSPSLPSRESWRPADGARDTGPPLHPLLPGHRRPFPRDVGKPVSEWDWATWPCWGALSPPPRKQNRASLSPLPSPQRGKGGSAPRPRPPPPLCPPSTEGG